MDPFFLFSAFNTCISSSDFDENKTQADKSCIAQAKALVDNLQSLNRDDTKYEAPDNYFTTLWTKNWGKCFELSLLPTLAITLI